MNLQEIKAAIEAGKKVRWSNDGYEVRKDEKLNEYNIICLSNNNCIGLTHMNGVTMNGKEEDFYILNTREKML